MKVGDRVYIHPQHTLIFPMRAGKVVKIDPSLGLPIFVKLEDNNHPFQFDVDELLTEEQLKVWEKRGKILCKRCQKEITGMFSDYCDVCLEKTFKWRYNDDY